jgi:hypothetical protein
MADNGKSSNPTFKKPLCFVIGPIGKDGSIERKHSDLLLNALIKQVLQQAEFGYTVKRADEDADPGMIGDRVVSDIINAEIVVADLTDLNPNAFYELGIRHSTEKPTIHVAKAGTALPFDNVSHRTIFVDLTDWHSIEQARIRLAESARAVGAPGYRVSNPITQANASFKMRQSEDPRDQVVAELRERINSIENKFSKSSDENQAVELTKEEESRVDLLFHLGEIAKKLHDEGKSSEQIRRDILRAASSANFKVRDPSYSDGTFAAEIGGRRMTCLL